MTRVDPEEAMAEYGLRPVAEVRPGQYDAIVLAVAHAQFATMGARRFTRWASLTMCCTTSSICFPPISSICASDRIRDHACCV